jgi:hypothetical protein
MKTRLLACVLLSFGAWGCGDEHDNHDDHNHNAGSNEVSLNAEACEHMANGPATALTAAATTEEATDTEHSQWEHKRVDLTLVDDGNGAFVGYVKYEAEAAGDYLFFADSEASITVAGTMAESEADVSECTDVAHVMTFELAVGEHVVEVRASSASVRLVVEVSGGHSDHGDHEGEHHEGEDHEGEDHEGEDHEGEDHEGEDHEGEDHEGEDHEGEDHEGEDHEGEDHEGEDHEGEDDDHEGEDDDHEGHGYD